MGFGLLLFEGLIDLLIFGKKPSEIRKEIVATAGAVLVLAAGILTVAASLPVAVLAVVGSVIVVATAVKTYFTENDVAAVIDAADTK